MWEELQRLPVGFLEQVIEFRVYERTKAMVDAADTPEARQRLPQTEMVNLVNTIEMELAQERIANRG